MRQPGLELQELNHESPPLSPHSAPQAWALARRFPGQGPAEERAAACHRYPRAFTTRPPWPAEAMLARGALHPPAVATSPRATAKRGACSAAGGRRAAVTNPASDGGLFDGRCEDFSAQARLWRLSPGIVAMSRASASVWVVREKAATRPCSAAPRDANSAFSMVRKSGTEAL